MVKKAVGLFLGAVLSLAVYYSLDSKPNISMAQNPAVSKSIGSILIQPPVSSISQFPVSSISQFPVSSISQFPVSTSLQSLASSISKSNTSASRILPVSISIETTTPYDIMQQSFAKRPVQIDRSLPLEQLMQRANITRLENPLIHINKSARSLELHTSGHFEKTDNQVIYTGGFLLAVYGCVFGRPPANYVYDEIPFYLKPKIKAGDHKTPEGVYFITNKNFGSQYYRSLGINYPNSVDAIRGFDLGLISKSTLNRISRAERSNSWSSWPSSFWGTPLGGTIFIHGLPNGGRDNNIERHIYESRNPNYDWTWGCVGVLNYVMDGLMKYISVGVPLVIDKSDERHFEFKPNLKLSK